jgi:DNA-binding transcriptional MerR regulator
MANARDAATRDEQGQLDLSHVGAQLELPIPDKQYFRIGEVARLLGVKPYVLRFWETEFRAIRPQKTKSQQRLYRRRDVELLRDIRRLLYEERYTIEGARQRLREPAEPAEPVAVAKQPEAALVGRRTAETEKIREELEEILKLVAE